MSKTWSRTNRYYVLTLIIAIGIWFLVVARELVGPLVVAALLAYVLNPAVAFVNGRTKLPRKWVVPLVYLVSLSILITLAVIFAPIIPEQTARLIRELQTIIVELETGLLIQPISLFGFELPLNGMFAEINPGMISADFIRPDVLLGVLQAASTNLGWLLVILVTTYSLLQDWPRLREWLLRLAPDVYQADARRLYEEVKTVWERYLVGQLRLSIIVGILTGLGTAVIGLPGALAFGVMAAIMDVVLTVGPTIVMLIAALVALFAGSTLLPIANIWFAVVTLALFGLVQSVENVWLRPRIMGHTLNLHPTLVFVAIIGSLALAGVLVALIIIPLMGSVFIISRYVYAKILEQDPWPE